MNQEKRDIDAKTIWIVWDNTGERHPAVVFTVESEAFAVAERWDYEHPSVAPHIVIRYEIK